MPRKRPRRWFQYAKKRVWGWRKKDPTTKRRRAMLRAHKGDLLASARACQALANVTTDPETRRKARADALYFFKKYKARRKRAKRRR